MSYWIRLRDRHPQVDFVDERKDWCSSDVVTLITTTGVQSRARYIVNSKTGDHLWQPVRMSDGVYSNCDVSMWSPGCPAA